MSEPLHWIVRETVSVPLDPRTAWEDIARWMLWCGRHCFGQFLFQRIRADRLFVAFEFINEADEFMVRS